MNIIVLDKHRQSLNLYIYNGLVSFVILNHNIGILSNN
jgi:hypothetical protein